MTRAPLVVASDNPGKLAELTELLDGLPYDLRPQSAFGLSTPEETGQTFADNALLKARHAHESTGHAAIADDSGLIVDALDGAPGVYSARYAGEDADAQANMTKLLTNMQGESRRQARFFCVIACILPGCKPILAEGAWEGRIADAPRGANGFGYDPVFFVPSENCTAAELPPEIKRKLSHRGRALAALRTGLAARAARAATDAEAQA